MAIKRIDHAAVRVADLGSALDWYEGVLGLTVLDRNDERVHLAVDGDAADLTLFAGGQSIETFAFGVDSEDDLDEIASRLKSAEIQHERYTNDDRPGHDAILGLELPSGHWMELVVGSNGRVAGQANLTSDGTFKPTDLDHINLLGDVSPDVMADFLNTVLGFKRTLKLSVAGNAAAAWLRTQERDHDLAYMTAQRKGDRLHHVAFGIEDGNHYFRISDRLAEYGHKWEFGPGRHIPQARQPRGITTNNFAYAFDPTGNRNEFSSDMPLIGADEPGVEIDITPEEVPGVMNGWADNMPDTFMTQGS